MTASLFARLWGATTIGILLVVRLSFPFDPIRRWLARPPHLETNDVGTVWRIVNHDGTAAHPDQFPSRKDAAANLRESDRVKAWLSELASCPYCTGFWAAAGLVLADAAVDGSWGMVWWQPVLWLTSAATAALLVVAMDH